MTLNSLTSLAQKNLWGSGIMLVHTTRKIFVVVAVCLLKAIVTTVFLTHSAQCPSITAVTLVTGASMLSTLTISR